MENKKMRTFRLPVEWSVWAWEEIEAETLRDAVIQLIDEIPTRPLPTEADYIDGTYMIAGMDEIYPSDKEDYYDKLIEYLKFYYDEDDLEY